MTQNLAKVVPTTWEIFRRKKRLFDENPMHHLIHKTKYELKSNLFLPRTKAVTFFIYDVNIQLLSKVGSSVLSI